MNKRKYGWIGAVLFVAWALSTSMASAADVNDLSVGFLASDDMISARLLWNPGGRVAFGADLTWMDGIGEENVEGWRPAFVGTYDLMQTQEFKALWFTAPATWYVGGLGGVLWPQEGDGEGDVDATVSLLTGFTFGDERARIGIEYQFALTDELWDKFGDVLADVPDQHTVLFVASLRF